MTFLRNAVVAPARNAVPFLVATVIWVVVMMILYGLFRATKPPALDYDAWVHASVFVPGLLGYLAHLLQQAFRVDPLAR